MGLREEGNERKEGRRLSVGGNAKVCMWPWEQREGNRVEIWDGRMER
jgi:hypothetical protein